MLYLAGIFLSFFLTALLIAKKKKPHADIVLMVWLAMIGLHLLNHYVYTSGLYLRFPYSVTIGFALPLVHGPLLFLYTTLQITAGKFRAMHMLHFAPALVSILLFGKFYLMSPQEQMTVLDNKGAGFRIPMLINLCMMSVSGVVYTLMSLIRLLRFRKNMVDQFSNTEKINFNWLLYLIVWMICIWIVVIFVGGDEIIFSTVSVFIIWLGYFGIRQVPVFSKPGTTASSEVNISKLNEDLNPASDLQSPTPATPSAANVKYQKSALSEAAANEIHARLTDFMHAEKPFTNPDLTLDELARSLNVHPNHLSQVINSKENKSFYDLINERRTAEFIRKISDQSSGQFTLLGIALDCGFNSKASFNRNFKKYTGFSPSAYLKQQTFRN